MAQRKLVHRGNASVQLCKSNMTFTFSKEERSRFLTIVKIHDKIVIAPRAINKCAQLGLLESIIWLRENGCPWNEWAIRYAAKAGHLEVVKWLRGNGCPWDEWVITWVAEKVHLEVVK